jgi:hypothetical protein
MMLLHSVYLFKISVYAFSGVPSFFQVPDMCKTANAIHRVKAEQDLTYFSGGAGVPMESIGSLLSAMGFKVVKQDEKLIDSEELESLVFWAEKGIKVRRAMRDTD